MRVALYARYSSDNQRDASIEDQFRQARDYASKQGWQIFKEYSDHAISGANLLRSGIQSLISDAQNAKFDIILAEALDRLSRDQEDIAGLYKRMNFCGVKIVTLSEGAISELHIGLKGTMNALFLKDLADKTRRGLTGRVEAGKSAGGKCYGYDIVKKYDTNGEPIRGERTINEKEATIIRRIFTEFAAGKSPKKIAVDLNHYGLRAPTGGDWGFSTILGNAKRGTGIINNELYIGKLIWNRQNFVKDQILAAGKQGQIQKNNGLPKTCRNCALSAKSCGKRHATANRRSNIIAGNHIKRTRCKSASARVTSLPAFPNAAAVVAAFLWCQPIILAARQHATKAHATIDRLFAGMNWNGAFWVLYEAD